MHPRNKGAQSSSHILLAHALRFPYWEAISSILCPGGLNQLGTKDVLIHVKELHVICCKLQSGQCAPVHILPSMYRYVKAMLCEWSPPTTPKGPIFYERASTARPIFLPPFFLLGAGTKRNVATNVRSFRSDHSYHSSVYTYLPIYSTGMAQNSFRLGNRYERKKRSYSL